MGTSKSKNVFKGKKKVVKKEKKEKPKVKRKLIEGVRGIVRVAEKDLFGEKKVRIALLRVKGVGKSLAGAVPNAAGIDPEVMVGSLTDEQLKKLENVIRDPVKYGIPNHMINRRFDPETGEDRHLASSKLALRNRFDIEFLRKIRSYRGIRHERGLPVRGQRTRSSFRKGGIVGVSRKRIREAKKGSKKGKKKK